MKLLLFILCFLTGITSNNDNENFLLNTFESVQGDIKAGIQCGAVSHVYLSVYLSVCLSAYYVFKKYFYHTHDELIGNYTGEFPLDEHGVCLINDPVDAEQEKSDFAKALSAHIDITYVIIGGAILILLLNPGNPYVGGNGPEPQTLNDFIDELKETEKKLPWKKVVLGDISEEFTYRFLLQSSLNFITKTIFYFIYDDEENAESQAQFVSLLIASTIFGLQHLKNYNPQWGQVVSATIGGYILGTVYNTNGIIASTVCHIEYNYIVLSKLKILIVTLSFIREFKKWYAYRKLPYSIQEQAFDPATAVFVP